MEYILTIGFAMAIYGGLWGVNAIMATRNNIFQEGFSFDVRYFLQGLLRSAVLAVAMGFGAFILIQIPPLFDQLGVILSEELANAISVLGIGASFAGGIISQAKKFRQNVDSTVNGEDVKVTLEKTHDFPSLGEIPLVKDNTDGLQTKD